MKKWKQLCTTALSLVLSVSTIAGTGFSVSATDADEPFGLVDEAADNSGGQNDVEVYPPEEVNESADEAAAQDEETASEETAEPEEEEDYATVESRELDAVIAEADADDGSCEHEFEVTWNYDDSSDLRCPEYTMAEPSGECTICHETVEITNVNYWHADYKEPGCNEVGEVDYGFDIEWKDGEREGTYHGNSGAYPLNASDVHSYMTDMQQQPEWRWEYDEDSSKWVVNAYLECYYCGEPYEYSSVGEDAKITVTSTESKGVTTIVAELKLNDFYDFHSGQLDGERSYKSTKVTTAAGLDISPVPDMYYDGGNAVIPDYVEVWFGGAYLEEGSDYVIKYKNNKNAGTASMTISGKGAYKGSATVNYSILPLDLACDRFQAYDIGLAYNGKAQKKAVNVYQDGAVLAKSIYKLEYSGDCKEEGSYKVSVTAKNKNYTGYRTYNINISKVDTAVVDASKVSVSIISDYVKMNPWDFDWESWDKSFTDDGGKPYKITYKGEDVTDAFDDPQFDPDRKAGVVNFTFQAQPGVETKLGSFSGQKVEKFICAHTDISKLDITLTDSIDWPGYAIDQWEMMDLTGFKITDSDYKQSEVDETASDDAPYELNTWDNLSVKLSGGTKAGKATLTIIGKGLYSGKLTKKITINKLDLGKNELKNTDDIKNGSISIGIADWYDSGVPVVEFPAEQGYTKGGTVIADLGVYYWNVPEDGTPWIDGAGLSLNKDYSVKYSGGDGVNKERTLTITGKGNYTGTVTKTFKVVERSFESTNESWSGIVADTNPVTIGKSVATTMKPYISKVTITDAFSGKKLQENKDYKLEYFIPGAGEDGADLPVDAKTKTDSSIFNADRLGTYMKVVISAVDGSGFSGSLEEYYLICNSVLKASEFKVKDQKFDAEAKYNDPTYVYLLTAGGEVPDPYDMTEDDYKAWLEANFSKYPANCRVMVRSIDGGYRTGVASVRLEVIDDELEGEDAVRTLNPNIRGGAVTVKFKVVANDLITK